MSSRIRQASIPMDLHPPNSTGQAYNVISMIYTQFNQFTQFDHPIRLVEFDRHLSQWIYTQFKFDRSNLTGQAYNVISMIYTQFKFDRAIITGQIG